MVFEDREEAGHLLARALQKLQISTHAIIAAIPRGGVVVGRVVADDLQLPLTVIVVRKIGAPNNPELAIGALGPHDTIYWDRQLCNRLGISSREKLLLQEQVAAQHRELEQELGVMYKKKTYTGKTVLLVDDGVATGATVIAASLYLKKEDPSSIWLVVPVIASDTSKAIAPYFSKIITLIEREDFRSVGGFYSDFPQVTSEEARRLLSSLRA